MPTHKVKLGVNSKAYYNSATRASPTWVEVKSIRELTIDATFGKAAANVRGERVNKMVKTNTDLNFTGSIRKDTAAATLAVINAAIAPDAILDMLFLDGSRTVVGSRGFRADVQVIMTGESQTIDDVVYNEIEFFPTPTDNEPVAVSIESESGSATYKEAAINDDALEFAVPS
jgi:hypothetical protein